LKIKVYSSVIIISFGLWIFDLASGIVSTLFQVFCQVKSVSLSEIYLYKKISHYVSVYLDFVIHLVNSQLVIYPNCNWWVHMGILLKKS